MGISMIDQSDITFVVQGGVDADLTPLALESICAHFPNSPIVVSTWENSQISSLENFKFTLIESKDPGCAPRGEGSDSKPNNINRQIVSTRSGLKIVQTKYVVKFRSDFILKDTSFLNSFGRFNKFDSEYQIFSDRLLVCMFGTRKPYGKHYTLPFHVSDFIVFGWTDDVSKLYDIPLVTDCEFKYFKINPHIPRATFAINRYNAEQSIIINCLRAQGKIIDCQYSTDISPHISTESDKYLVNNFYPLSFGKFGAFPMKQHLLPKNNREKYSDYYTEFEWLELYRLYVDENHELPLFDWERVLLNVQIRLAFIRNRISGLLSRLLAAVKTL